MAGATVSGSSGSAVTNGQGVALLFVDRAASAPVVAISRESFVQTSIAVPTTGPLGDLSVTLARTTAPAGGSLSSRSNLPPVVDGSRRSITFETELVLVDGDSRSIDDLQPTDFVLRSCTPDAANGRIDCVQGADADADVGYAATSSTPAPVQLVPGRPERAHAAALLLDQSGSIGQSDPTGARLFAAKAFLNGLRTDDRALLAAFAGNPGAVIPTSPLTVYPPFRSQDAARSYFPTLDTFATLLGGNTPLYDALDELRQQVVADPALPAGLARAVVVFTDGAATNCGDAGTCRSRREQSIQAANRDGVPVFTIGLSRGVDVAALGELANRTGGALLYAETAEQLLPLYRSVGRLLSLSLPTYRLKWTVQAAGTTAVFQTGSTLLGRVQVSARGRTFDVPFVINVP